MANIFLSGLDAEEIGADVKANTRPDWYALAGRKLVVVYHRRIAAFIDDPEVSIAIGPDRHVPAAYFRVARQGDVDRLSNGNPRPTTISLLNIGTTF